RRDRRRRRIVAGGEAMQRAVRAASVFALVAAIAAIMAAPAGAAPAAQAAPPTISISDASQPFETGSGSGQIAFTVTVNGPTSQQTIVSFATGDDPNAQADHRATA